MRRSQVWLARVAFLLSVGQFWMGDARAEADLAIADGLKVTIEYTLTLPDKSVADSNVGQAPFSYVRETHQIVPGLEQAMVGLKAGQKKRVNVTPEGGYGVYDKNARMTVKKAQVPAEVKAGTLLRSPDGRSVTVLEVSEKDVILDLNHPLAGKNLVFDVKVVKVEKQAPQPSAPKTP